MFNKKKKMKQMMEHDEIVVKLNDPIPKGTYDDDMLDEVVIGEIIDVKDVVVEKKKDIQFSDFDPTVNMDTKKDEPVKATNLSMSDLDEVEENEVFEAEEILEDPMDDGIEEITGETLEEAVVVEKKDLNKFFEEGKEKSKKLRKTEKKEKKKSKRSKKKEHDLQDVKDRKIFRYRNKKYTKVEDFVKFLLDHYLDLDEIAAEVLDDENFYGWVSKRSGIFEQSLKEFKEMKEKIEEI